MSNIILTQTLHSVRENFISSLPQCNLSFDCHVDCRLSNSLKKSSKSIFQLLHFNCVTQSFTGHGISRNCLHLFHFEKLISHETLVTGRVTASTNNQTQLFK